MTTEQCYRERTNGVYFTRNTHRTDCTDPDCRGCRPCAEKRHCTATKNCSWHIAEGELTCGRCIAAARRDLRWISALAALLMPAALSDGGNSEAANLAGPTADPEAWTWRKVAASAAIKVAGISEPRTDESPRDYRRRLYAAKVGAWHVSLVEDDDEHHPHAVLGIWARMLTEDYGHEMPELAPLSWCSAYLDRTLACVAHDGEQDFPQLARELRKCRQHLESVLHNDDRTERGAPCPECTSDEAGVGPRLRREYGHWCDSPDCERIHHADDSDDVWICPRDRDHVWSHEDYGRWVEERRRGRRSA